MYIIQYSLQATFWVLENLLYVIIPAALLFLVVLIIRDMIRFKNESKD